MNNRTITLCYRKIIDAQSSKAWEKMVFADSYAEFKMQAQLYNQEQRYNTLAELLHHVPNANQLHFLVSSAAVGYVRQLNALIPDIIDNLGRLFLTFTNFRFEIINSHLHDQAKHQVAINFYSDPVIWHDTIGDYLLISNKQENNSEILTHLFRLQPFLSIYSLAKLT